MRLDMNLPSVAVALLAAAVAQELVPALPGVPVKVPFLTAVALYHALTKPVPVALTAIVWAGALTDALGGLPLFCTLSFLLMIYWVARLLQRVFLEATLVQGTLLVACAAVGQALWTRTWVGAGEPLIAWRTLAALAAAAPSGVLAGFVGFAVCGLMDRFSGAVKPVKEGNGILWAETDR
jgi:hypothetical protein